MKIPDFKSISNTESYKINELEIEDLQDYKWSFRDFDNDRNLLKYIKKLEKHVRSSYEYKQYIAYLKDKVNLTQCNYFHGIDIKDIKGTSIEFHHYPFNLFEIVHTVLKKQTNNYLFAPNSFDVVNEVAKIHYENIVGLVPLSKTVHELAHSGMVFISLNDIHGNIDTFTDKYGEFISEDLYDKLEVLNRLTNDPSSNENKILDKSFQYIIDKERNIEKIALEEEQQSA